MGGIISWGEQNAQYYQGCLPWYYNQSNLCLPSALRNHTLHTAIPSVLQCGRIFVNKVHVNAPAPLLN